MHSFPKSRVSRRRRVLAALFSVMAAGAVWVVGLLAVAAFAVYQVGKAVTGQLLGSMLEGIAAASALVATLAAIVLAALVIMVLQTPPLLAPFGPLAEVIRFGLRVWVGRS